MKISEIKEMPEKELIERLEATRAELARLKINHAISPVEDSTKWKSQLQLPLKER